MVKVLHLSHTDIKYDARILKEMTALAKSSEDYQIYGIGVSMDEGSTMSSQASALEIYSINLFSRRLTYFPKILRHSLTLFELIVKTFLKAIKLKPEIIHCHDTLVLPLGVMLKCWSKSKLIYDAHELESDRNGLSKILSKLTLFAEKIAWPFVNLLITVSPSIQNWYQNSIGKKKSEVILNSPILHINGESNSHFGKNYLRQKYGIASTEMIFIYVGIFGKGRGIESFIDVFSGLKEAHLVFIGFGEFTELIAKHSKLYSNIHLHPTVPHENVVDVVRSADVGLCMIGNVSLSDYYCLPNKLFEYCFAGVPVIASDFPDIITIVNKFNLGICCGQDSESIRKTVELFINNKINMHIDIKTLEELSWEAQKVRLLNVYKNLLSI